MDDPLNQNQPGEPTMPGGDVPPSMGGMPPPPPPPTGGLMGGGPEGPPHEQILAALERIEEKLATIAAKIGV